MLKEKIKYLTLENNSLKKENAGLKTRLERMQKMLQERNNTINELRDTLYGSKIKYNRGRCRKHDL